MKTLNKIPVAILGLTILTTACLQAGNGKGNGNPNPGIVPAHSEFKGKTAGEWTVAWWQWVLGTPGNVQMYDDTGEHAYVNNNGADGVFFLAKSWAQDAEGNYGVLQVREVVVPSGTPLLIPVMGIGSFRSSGGILDRYGSPEGFLQTFPYSDMHDLEIVIDGQPVAGLEDGNLHYLNHFGFDGEFPLVVAPDGSLLESIGYEISLILTPLAPGEHIIEMRGKSGPDFASNVAYLITVEPGK